MIRPGPEVRRHSITSFRRCESCSLHLRRTARLPSGSPRHRRQSSLAEPADCRSSVWSGRPVHRIEPPFVPKADLPAPPMKYREAARYHHAMDLSRHPRVHVRAATPTPAVDACPSPIAAALGSAENRRPMPKRACTHATRPTYCATMGICWTTWHPSTRPAHAAPDPATKWLELKVHDHRMVDDSHAEVEFVARYRMRGRDGRMRERSRFVREVDR